jgi:hypothetical protein
MNILTKEKFMFEEVSKNRRFGYARVSSKPKRIILLWKHRNKSLFKKVFQKKHSGRSRLCS